MLKAREAGVLEQRRARDTLRGDRWGKGKEECAPGSLIVSV